MMSFSEERGPSEERPKMWKEELGFEYGVLLGRVFKCLNKLVGSTFYLPPALLARCPCGSQHIVVRGRKLVLRANAARFS